MKRAHILFLKYPEAGKVKTRLAKDIGDEKAAELYKLMAEEIIFSCAVPDIDVLLFIEPFAKLDDFKRWLGDGFKYFPQADTDLGDRMFSALQTAFDEGYQSCVLTGSDIPDLNADVMYDAFEKIDDDNAVVGASKDGGYYLIGFNENNLTDKVFTNMQWSTERVFDETVLRFKKVGLGVKETYVLSDVDTITDLKNLKHSMSEILEAIGLTL